MRHQKGSICLRSGSFYCRAYVNGKQKNYLLVRKDDKHHSATCKPVRMLRDEVMSKVNSMLESASALTAKDFWTSTYLPYATENLRPSSVRSYQQIWKQHLLTHLGQLPLNAYTTPMGSVFLTSLSKRLGRRTLAHVRSLMSSMFAHALNLGLIGSNPIREVKILGKVRVPAATTHYTLEEIEDIISALADHVDAQLVIALGFYEGLRPSEIGAVQWNDIDSGFIHIRRACVRGVVGPTKTPESQASLPLIEPVKTLLALWAAKSAPRTWVFENRNGEPADLHNMVGRVIIPTLKKKGLKFKGLYAARRGAATMLVGLTGSLVPAQELLRHKSLTTTAMFYKKTTASALKDGMKMLEAASKKHD